MASAAAANLFKNIGPTLTKGVSGITKNLKNVKTNELLGKVKASAKDVAEGAVENMVSPGAPGQSGETPGPETLTEKKTNANANEEIGKALKHISDGVKGFKLFSSLFESRSFFSQNYKFKKEINHVFKRVKEKTCQIMNRPDFYKMILESTVFSIQNHLHNHMHFFDKIKDAPNAVSTTTTTVFKRDYFFYQMYDNLFVSLMAIDNPEAHLFIINECCILIDEIENKKTEETEETEETEDSKKKHELNQRIEWLNMFIEQVVSNDVFVEYMLSVPEFLDEMSKNEKFLKNMVEKQNSNGRNELTDELVQHLKTTGGIDDFMGKLNNALDSKSGGGFPVPPGLLKSVSLPKIDVKGVVGNKLQKSLSVPNIGHSLKVAVDNKNLGDLTDKLKNTAEKLTSGKIPGDLQKRIGDLTSGKEGATGNTPQQPKDIILPDTPDAPNIKVPDDTRYFNLKLIKHEIKDTLDKIKEKICEMMSRKEFHSTVKDTVFNDIEQNITIHSEFFKPLNTKNTIINVENSYFYNLYFILFRLLVKYENERVYSYITDHCVKIINNLKENKDKNELELSGKEQRQLKNQKIWLNKMTENVVLPRKLFLDKILDKVSSTIFRSPSFLKYSAEGTFLPHLVNYWTSDHYSSVNDIVTEAKILEEDKKALEDEGDVNPSLEVKMQDLEVEKQKIVSQKREQFKDFIKNLENSLNAAKGIESKGGNPGGPPPPPPGANLTTQIPGLPGANLTTPPLPPVPLGPPLGPPLGTTGPPGLPLPGLPPPGLAPQSKFVPETVEVSEKEQLTLINKHKGTNIQHPEPQYNQLEIGHFNKTDNCPNDIMGLLGITSKDNDPVIKRVIQKSIHNSAIGLKFQEFFIDIIHSVDAVSMEKIYEETKAKEFSDIYQETQLFKQNQSKPDSEENQGLFIQNMTQKNNQKQLVQYILSIPNCYEIVLDCVLKNKKRKSNRLYLFRKLLNKMSATELFEFLSKQKPNLNCPVILQMIQKMEQKGGTEEKALAATENIAAPTPAAQTPAPTENKPAATEKTQPETEVRNPETTTPPSTLKPTNAIQNTANKITEMGMDALSKIASVPDSLAKLNKKQIILPDKECSPEILQLVQKNVVVEKPDSPTPIDVIILKKMVVHFADPEKIDSIFVSDVLKLMSISSAERNNVVKRLLVLLLKRGLLPTYDIQKQQKGELLNKIFSKLPDYNYREVVISVFDNLSTQLVLPGSMSFVELMNKFYDGYEDKKKMEKKLNEVIKDMIRSDQVDKAKIESIKKVCLSTEVYPKKDSSKGPNATGQTTLVSTEPPKAPVPQPQPKAPEQTSQKAPGQTSQKAPEQTSQKAPEQTSQKATKPQNATETKQPTTETKPTTKPQPQKATGISQEIPIAMSLAMSLGKKQGGQIQNSQTRRVSYGGKKHNKTYRKRFRGKRL